MTKNVGKALGTGIALGAGAVVGAKAARTVLGDNRGWRNESKRHSLARQGVKTGRKIRETSEAVRPLSIRTSEFERELKKRVNALDEYQDLNVSLTLFENVFDLQIDSDEGHWIVKGISAKDSSFVTLSLPISEDDDVLEVLDRLELKRHQNKLDALKEVELAIKEVEDYVAETIEEDQDDRDRGV